VRILNKERNKYQRGCVFIELYENLVWKAYDAVNYSQSLDFSKKAMTMERGCSAT
jgi:hypothetical protein